MGFFSSVKSAVSKATSSVSSLASKATSNVSNFASVAKNKLGSASNIVGTNVKNSFSKESLAAFAEGYAKGGLAGAIGNAVMTTTIKSMTELDKSGDWNPEYEYKKHDFPSKVMYETALSYGYSEYSNWIKACKIYNIDPNTGNAVSVVPAESVSSVSVDNVGNLVVDTHKVKIDTDGTSKNETSKLVIGGAIIGKLLGVF